jgi:serine/threonine-protein kinase HipA
MINLRVYFKDQFCGVLTQHSRSSYSFAYDSAYLGSVGSRPISVNLPLRPEPFLSERLFPFFDSLISEGWLLDVQTAALKLDKSDRFALIQKCGLECMGAVSLRGEDD